ncbi:alpha-N-acetylgalactosaminide alpha-2,6-sialyltransferase 6 [Erinaceus europaeus]|uniref:Alpha-N-acetylgalactosaminide alpha-2,6-sialyltransferase 6 n=1 Tax=Erinaceus europaeus TaxID=9365 RepID=A0ABM3Y6T9_ERIEU|nr:alpha-N-acetylgalactosaminide alpha-2,6-sialyltransferase 6 [Erinaceus europaeus]
MCFASLIVGLLWEIVWVKPYLHSSLSVVSPSLPHREKSHSWLSTGWFTMVIAVELCDHVHVYGMVPPDYCSHRPRLQRMPYHYYEPKGPDECVTYIQNEHSRKGNHHRFITEKKVFSSWAQLYGITFSHPSWI